MNISLTAKLERYVRTKVKSGNYNNASEVIREALRAMIEREDLRTTSLRGELAERVMPYQPESRSTSKVAQPRTKPTRQGTAEERKLARLRAAIREGIESPDDPEFSFDKIRASFKRNGRRKS